MQFSLTSLKYQDIRQQIIKHLNANNPYAISNGGQYDFSSANLSIFIDSMAYICMTFGYDVSFVTNNYFLGTTEIRENAVSKASEIGYTPKRPYASRFAGTFVYTGSGFVSGNSLSIYARSPFVGSLGNIYYNMQPIVLNYKSATELEGEYLISQGSFNTYSVTPTGEDNFFFVINNPNIDQENFTLYVIPTNVYDSTQPLSLYTNYIWTGIDAFTNLMNPKSYYLEEDVTTGYPLVMFGNAISGANVPTDTDIIIVEYFDTKGSAANNELLNSLPPSTQTSTNTPVYVYYNTSSLGIGNTFSTDKFSVSFQNAYNKSFGGTDLESLSSIQANAPRFYSSAGRAVTQDDYIYLLSTFVGIGAIYVIGGDALFPGDQSHLGNIYICLVPTFTPAEFLTNNSIYVTPIFQSQIKLAVEDHPIISTKRFFYKPTYILINAIPTIEIAQTLTTADKNSISNQVTQLLTTYFETTFDALGVPFRSSKLNTAIDNLLYVESSSIALDYSFVINNNTIAGMSTGVDNFLYLPIKNIKDSNGNVTGTTNFVRTNSKNIETIYDTFNWSILKDSFDSLSVSNQAVFKSNLSLLNAYQKDLPANECTIYSKEGLINIDSFDRYLYNDDIITIEIANFNYVDNQIVTYNAIPFTDQFGNIDSLEISVLNNIITLYFSYLVNNIQTLKDVGTLTYSNGKFVVTVSNTQQANLQQYFGIDENFYFYNYETTPFNVVANSLSNFSINIKTAQNVFTNLNLKSSKDIFDVIITNGVHKATALESFTFTAVGSDPIPTFYNISSGSIVIGDIENSHLALNYDPFKGFLNDEFDYSAINLSTLTIGDYYIVSSNFNVTTLGNTVYYFKGTILYYNGAALAISTIKETLSSASDITLNTVYSQNQLFTDASTSPYYRIYTGGDVTNLSNFPLLTDLIYANNVYGVSVDGSQLLPTPLTDGTMIKIVMNSTLYPTGIEIYYPQTTNSKINTLYNWDLTPNSSTIVYDSDLILYKDTGIPSTSYWVLITNLNGVAGRARVLDNIGNAYKFKQIESLDEMAPYLYQIYQIAGNVPILIDTNHLSLFPTLPPNNILNVGDYLICTDATANLWEIFNDDYFDFYIDAVNANSTFPVRLLVGDMFTVKLPGTPSNTNFGGETGSVYYADGDKIIYEGNNEWEKFTSTNLPAIANRTNIANIGDLVTITDIGNFQNDTSKLNVPLYDSNMQFSYFDTLIFTNTGSTGNMWIKVNPINIYNTITNTFDTDPNRAELNDLGYNSDLRLSQTGNYNYTIYLNDKYNGVTIGQLNYNTGLLTLKLIIPEILNELTTNPKGALSNIFDVSNYSDQQMDIITMIPNGTDDFDTLFDQYIIGKVEQVVFN